MRERGGGVDGDIYIKNNCNNLVLHKVQTWASDTFIDM